MEGAGLRLDDRSRETNACFGGEFASRAETSEHCPVLRSDHRQKQHNPIHRDGVL